MSFRGLYREGFDFLGEVWNQQPAGWCLIRTRSYDPDDWTGYWAEKGDGEGSGDEIAFDFMMEEFEDGFPEDQDVYFAPAVFSERSARRECVLPSAWAFADLDYVHPSDAVILPTVAWQTSPGKWQAMWLMNNLVERLELRSLNRAICQSSGADPGTWNENRILRVPGTTNMKHERKREMAGV